MHAPAAPPSGRGWDPTSRCRSAGPVPTRRRCSIALWGQRGRGPESSPSVRPEPRRHKHDGQRAGRAGSADQASHGRVGTGTSRSSAARSDEIVVPGTRIGWSSCRTPPLDAGTDDPFRPSIRAPAAIGGVDLGHGYAAAGPAGRERRRKIRSRIRSHRGRGRLRPGRDRRPGAGASRWLTGLRAPGGCGRGSLGVGSAARGRCWRASTRPRDLRRFHAAARTRPSSSASGAGR